jgi:uncharacterized protein (TIGR02588 family)
MSDKQIAGENKRTGTDAIPASEWIVSGIGLILVLGSLGFLVYKGIAVEQQPPLFVAQWLETVELEDDYLVKFQVFNRGGESVSSLTVLAEMHSAGGKAIERQVNIDYLPAHSSRQIAMLFPTPPDQSSLLISFGGYQVP